jgi:hypothetical protein
MTTERYCPWTQHWTSVESSPPPKPPAPAPTPPPAAPPEPAPPRGLGTAAERRARQAVRARNRAILAEDLGMEPGKKGDR